MNNNYNSMEMFHLIYSNFDWCLFSCKSLKLWRTEDFKLKYSAALKMDVDI